jgi:gliding motility-associated-like protein
MVKKFFSILLFSFTFLSLSATHNRAGEITYSQISDLTFEITITTFTYTLSLADRPRLDVEWGDNSTTTAPRIEIDGLPNYYQKNVYKATHTFPGPGIYRIVVQDPNRNFGVLNIPNSVNVVFSIQTFLTVNPAIGHNDPPFLLNPPYDKAAKGHVFIHNPGAYDYNGDSLSYKLTVCTREDGRPIENYTYPPATHKFYVDSISGDLVWDAPPIVGTYNVAMEIQEWRNNIKIGMVERDMQIEVFETTNHDPLNGQLKDLCVEAGDTVSFLVTSTDQDGEHISLKATSGAFELVNCKAKFTKVDSIAGKAVKRFFWIPCYETVRNQPYNIIIKSEDDNSELSLFDIDNMNIKVLGPAPVLTNVFPEGKFMKIAWKSYGTSSIAGFNIYRKEGKSSFSPDSCTNGIPGSVGFVKIGYAPGSSTVTFTDTENGVGLQFGVEYAYRIVAVYSNGTESKVSNEISSSLVSGIPLITNVSVKNTSNTDGTIYIAWRKPDIIDTVPGPFEYLIYRSEGITGSDYHLIDSIGTIDLNDTVYTNTHINTQSKGYIYKIELYNNKPGNRYRIGDPGIASSLFMEVSPGDKKAKISIKRNVPWINSRYDLFRYNESTFKYDSVNSSDQIVFNDTGLENGIEYRYYVRSTGNYLMDNYPKNLINFSQEGNVTPIDNEPPCPPVLKVSSQCDSLFNKLTWTIDDPNCFEDIKGYNIFYKPRSDENLSLLISIDNPNTFKLIHNTSESVAGCYAISAFDSEGNESDKSVMICIDSCNIFYEIPNVFTPNGDNINDYLVAKTSELVESVDFKIFNRNGLMLFQTSDPKLNWDGTYNGKIVSPGVYFYQCDRYERRIAGLIPFHMSGFIHVITEKDAKVNKQEFK